MKTATCNSATEATRRARDLAHALRADDEYTKVANHAGYRDGARVVWVVRRRGWSMHTRFIVKGAA